MIVIAPFSNDALRDWPIGHFEQLLDLCIERLNDDFVLVGASEQRESINRLVRGRPAHRVRNMAGLWTWAQTKRALEGTRALIANNSGLAHLGAQLGLPTVCIFAASHDPMEWGPRGPKVRILYSKTACSPCAMSTAMGCPFGHECMINISPEHVFGAVQQALVAAGPSTS